MFHYLPVITLDPHRRIQWHLSSCQSLLYPPNMQHSLNGCEWFMPRVGQSSNHRTYCAHPLADPGSYNPNWLTINHDEILHTTNDWAQLQQWVKSSGCEFKIYCVILDIHFSSKSSCSGIHGTCPWSYQWCGTSGLWVHFFLLIHLIVLIYASFPLLPPVVSHCM